MTLEAGSAVAGTGLAGLIAEYTAKATGMDPAKYPESTDALAQAIVEYILANAEAYVAAGIPVDTGGVTTAEGVGGIR